MRTCIVIFFMLLSTAAYPSDNSPEVISLDTSPETVARLQKLGLVWGYLKYHHPAVASGSYDWDAELFKNIVPYINASSDKEAEDILALWTSSLGPYKTAEYRHDTLEIVLMPDYRWLEEMPEGKLRTELLNLKNAERPYNQHYVEIVEGYGLPRFTNEKLYDANGLPDTVTRLLGLFRYWNIVQYYSPYRNRTDDDWYNVLEEFIPRFIDAKDDKTYRYTIIELVARLCDGHTGTTQDIVYDYEGEYMCAPYLQIIEDRLVVADFFSDDKKAKGKLEKGDIILKVDGEKIQDILLSKRKYNLSGKSSEANAAIAAFITRTADKDKKTEIEFERSGETYTDILPVVNFDKLDFTPLYGKPSKQYLHFIRPGVVHIEMGNIPHSDYPRIIPVLDTMQAIILDFRKYTTGSPVLWNYLLPEEKEIAKYSKIVPTQPGMFHMAESVKLGKSGLPQYKGKVAVLANESCFSATELSIMASKLVPGAVVIGTSTSGTNGNTTYPFFFPGGHKTNFSSIGVYYPDGGQTQRIGIPPDVICERTIAGVGEGRDELLEKALEILGY